MFFVMTAITCNINYCHVYFWVNAQNWVTSLLKMHYPFIHIAVSQRNVPTGQQDSASFLVPIFFAKFAIFSLNVHTTKKFLITVVLSFVLDGKNELLTKSNCSYVFFTTLCDLFRAIDTWKVPKSNDYSKLRRLFFFFANLSVKCNTPAHVCILYEKVKK